MGNNLFQKLLAKLGLDTPEFSEGLIDIVDIFKRGMEKYNTFRIPGIVICPNNIVNVFVEARKNNASDLGEIDCAMRRSEDGGKTWGPIKVIWKGNGLAVQNPCPVYIPETKEIIMPFIIDRKIPHVMKSLDFGKTWEDVRKIDNLIEPDWNVNGCCPGHSILLKTGRIITPFHHNEGEKSLNNKIIKRGIWNSHLVYSDDYGKTWDRGHIFTDHTNEAMCVELTDGRILTILRQNRENPDPHLVMLSLSDDKGLTSSPPKSCKDLPGPVCQASIVQFTNSNQFQKSRLLFSNPNSIERRIKLTIKMSYDEGKSWPVQKILYHQKSAYSDLAVLPDQTICCVIECGVRTPVKKIVFAKFDLNWLTDGKDKLIPKN
jgi:sialidase-1